MRTVKNLDDWQKEIEEKLSNTPPSMRPKKKGHKTRSTEKKLALAISCKKAWDEWLATGFLVVTEKGYKLCPEKI
ncbi:MAG: hypothetical protein Q4D21_00520 [Phascolarctobacterium sp.]|nr:hypothetical protein [Phascolarctobacterium sp.]